jgi:MFS transporter, DHA1 family, multidrug resistance protein
VYLGDYQMTLGQLGLIFLSLMTGCLIGAISYIFYLRSWFLPMARKFHNEHGHAVAQEEWVRPGILGTFGPVIGLLLFA